AALGHHEVPVARLSNKAHLDYFTWFLKSVANCDAVFTREELVIQSGKGCGRNHTAGGSRRSAIDFQYYAVFRVVVVCVLIDAIALLQPSHFGEMRLPSLYNVILPAPTLRQRCVSPSAATLCNVTLLDR